MTSEDCLRQAMLEKGAKAVIALLEVIGEDPTRDGLRDTPLRVAKMLQEVTAGYKMFPEQILSKTFDEKFDEMVVLRKITFKSLCEHHMLPFIGEATVGYVPSDCIVGISKLARLVECYSRRLQVQERLTSQIANSLVEYLKPKGVGVVMVAHHSCMGCRGVNLLETEMVTSSMLGCMRDPAARAEFMAMAGIR